MHPVHRLSAEYWYKTIESTQRAQTSAKAKISRGG